MKVFLVVLGLMVSSLSYAENCNTYCTDVAGSTSCQTVCTQ